MLMSSTGFAATLLFLGTFHAHSLEVHVTGSLRFCSPCLLKSSMAKRIPPTWLHWPWPPEPNLSKNTFIIKIMKWYLRQDMKLQVR